LSANAIYSCVIIIEVSLLFQTGNGDDKPEQFAEETSNNDALLHQIGRLEVENQQLSSQLADVHRQNKTKDEEARELHSRYEALKEKYRLLQEGCDQQKKGFVEELNEMNEALKQRGELIAKLEAKYEASVNELKVLP